MMRLVSILLLITVVTSTACAINTSVASYQSTSLTTGNRTHCVSEDHTYPAVEGHSPSASAIDSPSIAENKTQEQFSVSHYYRTLKIANDTYDMLNIFYTRSLRTDSFLLPPHAELDWVLAFVYDIPVTIVINNSNGTSIYNKTKTGKEWRESELIIVGSAPPATHLLLIENGCGVPITVSVDDYVLTRLETWMTARYYYPDDKSVLYISAVNDNKTMTCNATYQAPQPHPAHELITLY